MVRTIEEEDVDEEVDLVVEAEAETIIPKKRSNRISKIGAVEDEKAGRVEQVSSVTTAASLDTTRRSAGPRKR